MKKRNTPIKNEIKGLLENADSALTQEAVLKKVQGHADRATVYRVLNSFCEDGLLHKVMSEDGKQYYAVCVNCKEKRHNHNHAHFHCIRCERVLCMKNKGAYKLPEGFTFMRMNCWITGICDECSCN